MNKKQMKVLFSHEKDNWETPQWLFDYLNQFYNFTLDPCATKENKKCDKYYTIEQNGLFQDWKGERVFVNPPYNQIKEWVRKCYEESKKNQISVALLIPARTDTQYFYDYVMKAKEIYFIKGRLKFSDSKNSAPFPSMIVVFKGLKEHNFGSPRIYSLTKGN